MPELKSLIEMELPSGDQVSVYRRRYGDGSGPRAAIVAGIRGDAPEGIRVAWQVARFLADVEEKLSGTIDIYPCVNPLAAEQGCRRWPFFDVDLNRLFPGRVNGHPPDRTAHALCTDVRGAQLVIELRGARPAFQEAPQAHVRLKNTEAAELARSANVAVVWARSPGPAAPSTFAHQFAGSIVLEGGSGNRLTDSVGRDLRDGVLNMLAAARLLPEDVLPFHWTAMQRPASVTDAQVYRVRAEHSGLFLPTGSLWDKVEVGQSLGDLIDPTTGEQLTQIVSPVSGRLLAIREQPAVFQGTMVARVVMV